MQTRRGRLREWLVLRGASCITAASAPVVSALADLGLTGQRVPLGVDLKAWPPRLPVPRQNGKPAMLIHVASLNRIKDQATLLRALASLKELRVEFEMDIVGEDTLDGEIQGMAGRLGLSRAIRFRGFLPQRQLRPLVEQSDLLIHSSRFEAGHWSCSRRQWPEFPLSELPWVTLPSGRPMPHFRCRSVTGGVSRAQLRRSSQTTA